MSGTRTLICRFFVLRAAGAGQGCGNTAMTRIREILGCLVKPLHLHFELTENPVLEGSMGASLSSLQWTFREAGWEAGQYASRK